MTNLKIMPDLPIELVRYNNDNQNQIIFNETYFIKKIFTSDANIEVLSSLCDLNIEGFNNHKKIFIDESGEFIYLIATYLEEYKDTYETILTMSSKEIITLFKLMLERLISAHQKDFNPYDLKYSNYLLDKDNKPVFTDFDFSFYKGKCTYNPPDTELKYSRDFLFSHDKIEILKLFLQSITSSFEIKGFTKREFRDLYAYLEFFYKNLQQRFIIPKDVEEYLDDLIFKKMLPKESDYFIENLINPLEKGLELKF